jgi:hypothetical protein
MSRTQLAAIAVAATALAISGCGGSSKTSATATTTAASTPPASTADTAPPNGKPLTRAALIAAGDAICARANAKTIVLQASSIKELARIYPQVAIYHRAEAAELKKLVPPASLANDWSRMISDLERQSRYVNEVARDINKQDERAARHPFEMADTTIGDLIETGKRAGFAHCSKLD